jgi:polysaccharide biosynthesis/export protein
MYVPDRYDSRSTCKTLVKVSFPGAKRLDIHSLQSHNEVQTVLAYPQFMMARDEKQKRSSMSVVLSNSAHLAKVQLGILLCLALATNASGQSPSLLPMVQTRPMQSGSELTRQLGQNRPCTPADYGDPTADCVSSFGQQPGYLPSGDSDMSSFSTIPTRPPVGAWDSGSPGADRVMGAHDHSSTTPIYNEKEPATEFQRYVAGSIGKMIPIFGASLFEHVPATFAPLDHAPVSTDYLIAPGDELQISVWGELNFSRRFSVANTGEVILPDAGPTSVEGMTYTQAASVIKARLSHFYRNFDVGVTLSRLHSIQIFVVGNARRPGSYTVSSFSTLVNALFSCGGPSSRGSMRDIQLKRAGRVVSHFDLYQLLVSGDKSHDARLVPGDVLFIPPAGPRIAVAGSVGLPAIYEMTSGTTLAEALQMADGLSSLAFVKQAQIERVNDGSALQVLHVSMNAEGLQTELRNGDIVRLLPIVPRFENAVTLRGNVANPGRQPWKEGMRLEDLIPGKEFLLTRDYWKARNLLGSAEAQADEDEPVSADPNSQPDPNSGLPTVRQTASVAGAAGPPQAAFQEQKRNTHGDASLGAAMGPDNVPAVRTFNPRYTVEPAVPEINWEYAVIERTDHNTLATRTIVFNLGKLVLQHDPAQNLQLLPGDVVTIFSKADFSVPHAQQRTQVRIEGEVAMAGLYTVMPGETLRQVLSRAGGLTSNAYIFGAQFTRETTRHEQQKRYDDFLDQLESEVSEAASNLSSRVTSPQQAATAQTSVTSQHSMIERLRKVAMNGRIVLNMGPDDQGIKAFPDLPLENGDRLYVPSRPSTVNVIGSVYEQSSFLYEEDYRTGDYLKKAGGPSRYADRSHMVVVRADGSVVSRRGGPALFANGFDSIPMYPGDTLVVPTYLNRSTLVRSLVDWSQILSNFGLGAAAINVLH